MNENLLIEWVRASRYCELTGEPLDTIYERITDGVWAAGLHYKRTGKRTLWINIPAVTAWINQQPHVESVPFPRGAKSSQESPADCDTFVSKVRTTARSKP